MHEESKKDANTVAAKLVDFLNASQTSPTAFHGIVKNMLLVMGFIKWMLIQIILASS